MHIHPSSSKAFNQKRVSPLKVSLMAGAGEESHVNMPSKTMAGQVLFLTVCSGSEIGLGRVLDLVAPPRSPGTLQNKNPSKFGLLAGARLNVVVVALSSYGVDAGILVT